MYNKPIIYQVLPRLFGNQVGTNKPNGTYTENGCGKMNFFTSERLGQIYDLGATHIWYTGVIRHATKTDYTKFNIPKQHSSIVKGNAGSPYAITDYYDIDPDLAVNVDKRMDEFLQLVKRTHDAHLKVVIDFVPNHVAREYLSVAKPAGIEDLGHGDDTSKHFSVDNNFYYCWGQPFAPLFDIGDYNETPAKATGNDHFDNHPGKNDWYETVKLNYGVDYCDAGGRSEHFSPIPDTWNKMLDILLFWASKGVDAFRCDMAEMVPTAFWHYATSALKSQYSEVLFIGEVYNPALYRSYLNSGFDYLYDKVGMYDTLRAVVSDDYTASAITGQWQSVSDIHDHMLYFLENHDEQRIASTFFCGDALKALPALVVSATLHKGPFMLYSGQEFGEKGMDSEGYSGLDGRTTIFDYWSVDSINRGYFSAGALTPEQEYLFRFYKKLLNISREEKAISQGKFFDLMYVNPYSDDFNPNRQYAYLRCYENELLLTVVNFSSEPVKCSVNIPSHAFDFLCLPEKKVTAKDLLSGENKSLFLSPLHPVATTVPAYYGRIYKINL